MAKIRHEYTDTAVYFDDKKEINIGIQIRLSDFKGSEQELSSFIEKLDKSVLKKGNKLLKDMK